MNLESIVAEIDEQIARLQSARALLSGVAEPTAGKRGRPAKVKIDTLVPAKTAKRRKFSSEALERIRQGQVKRWAAAKKATKPNLKAAARPLPKARKKSAKSAS